MRVEDGSDGGGNGRSARPFALLGLLDSHQRRGLGPANRGVEDCGLGRPSLRSEVGGRAQREGHAWPDGGNRGLAGPGIRRHLGRSRTVGHQGGRVSYWAMSVPAEDELALTGKYVMVWRQDADGNWRLYRDVWNDGP